MLKDLLQDLCKWQRLNVVVFFYSVFFFNSLHKIHVCSQHCESKLLLLRYMITTQPEEYLNYFLVKLQLFQLIVSEPILKGYHYRLPLKTI